ncbi:MAG: FHA domain-containing protein [Planctomycetes bacterium]|nr:FHA domain-containing protein [Planctomycetota bacterium]
MSFRLFIYYCAVSGGWAAFLGWLVGRAASPRDDLGGDATHGMMLGLFVALGLGLVDGFWNLATRWKPVAARTGVAAVVGAIGGLIGGVLGNVLYDATNGTGIFLIIGWTLTGLLIGVSLATFEIVAGLVTGENLSGARKKLVKCLLGGALGGFVGGGLAAVLLAAWTAVLKEGDARALWSPFALGFVALGMCIGLLVGLAQVILKEAWIKVEAGFRSGRELILAKERTSIGRSEFCDVPIFGDSSVDKQHASIIAMSGQYLLESEGGSSGILVNDEPVRGRLALRSGDLIRMGKNMFRFFERQKRVR